MLIWRIIAIDDYIGQVSQLSITVQDNIQRKWVEFAEKENIEESNTVRCIQGHDYFLTIFSGLEYEFVYKVDHFDKTIELISCERLTFLDHGQPD